MQQMSTMETSVSNELLEGEQLLWSGSPGPGKSSVASPGRVFSILGLIYSPIGLLFLIAGLVVTLTAQGALNPLPLIFFIVGGVFFPLGLIFLGIGLFARFPSQDTFYAITDRRVIIVQGGRNVRVTSYGKRAITQLQRIEHPDGSGDLVFSGNASASYGNANYSTFNANRPGIFAAIPNVRQVERYLISLLSED